ncbi:MAG: hypothetical protein M5U28_48265 [Sandaracinaceae bacterium]|nr:hypothetical protein [Sandaracinaceae bacterium]
MEVALAIARDELVLVRDVGAGDDGPLGVLDLREPDALLDELTSRGSPGRVRIESWSGAADREVGLGDLA